MAFRRNAKGSRGSEAGPRRHFPAGKAAMKKAPFVAAALATAPLALIPNPAAAQTGNSAPSLSVGPHVVPLPADAPRAAERRVGTECVRPCRFRGAPYHKQKKRQTEAE